MADVICHVVMMFNVIVADGMATFNWCGKRNHIFNVWRFFLLWQMLKPQCILADVIAMVVDGITNIQYGL